MLKKILIGIFSSLAALLIALVLYLNYLGEFPRFDYETQAPDITHISKPAVLIFSKTNGFIHHDALPAADELLQTLAKEKGYQVFLTKNGAIHNPQDLNKFDLVIWNNVSGDVLNEQQKNSFKLWMQQGGRWLGIHASGGDLEYKWRWYVEDFIGAQFIGHPMWPQFQDAHLYKLDEQAKVTQHLPTPWQVPEEEWYAFDSNPQHKGYEVLMRIDEASYQPNGEILGMVDTMDGLHPLVWRKSIAQGKMFYSAIGHQAATYQNPQYQTLLSRAMDWLLEKDLSLSQQGL